VAYQNICERKTQRNVMAMATTAKTIPIAMPA
jgi:hypothetical protein